MGQFGSSTSRSLLIFVATVSYLTRQPPRNLQPAQGGKTGDLSPLCSLLLHSQFSFFFSIDVHAMDPHSLLASACINIGLAFVVLSLFSIFKKQPSVAPIYYARRLSQRHRIPFDPPLTVRRFTPSVSWITRAFRVTEDEILNSSGLDALIIIRLFKFGSVSVHFSHSLTEY